MTVEAAWKPLGVGALAVVAAGCAGPRGSSLDQQGVEELVNPVVGGEQRLEASDAAEFDQFGYSVSLASDHALLGAYGEDFYRGAVYVFVQSGSAWSEEQKLVASDAGEGDDFGWSVSLGADRALIGAYADDSYRGAAYVFVQSSSAWSEEQKLVASDGADSDDFGWSVALAGDRALVGAPGSDTSRGAAYVLVRSGSFWSEEQKLIASDGAEGDQLGYSVSLAGDRALVGAPGSDTSRGAAYVFVRSSGSWTLEQKLVASDGAESDQLGVSVSLGADRALLGAYWDDSLRGAAYVFVRSSGSWTEEQKLVASDGAEGHRFGNSTSLGADRALIGAYGNNYARGAAYAFVRSGGSWTEGQKLVASDGADNDLFGWSVSLADDRALAGAHYDDNLRGAAYVFSLGLTNGDPCSADAACEGGFCADGVCCDTACGGTCEACTAALKGDEEDGTCGYVAAGLNPPRSSSNPTADCAPGARCTASGECASAPGSSAPADGAGCACRAGGSPGQAPGFWVGGTLALLLLRRRRRSATPRRRRPAPRGAPERSGDHWRPGWCRACSTERASGAHPSSGRS
jgi:MYXO-CTERM domain-containing protein